MYDEVNTAELPLCLSSSVVIDPELMPTNSGL